MDDVYFKQAKVKNENFQGGDFFLYASNGVRQDGRQRQHDLSVLRDVRIIKHSCFFLKLVLLTQLLPPITNTKKATGLFALMHLFFLSEPTKIHQSGRTGL